MGRRMSKSQTLPSSPSHSFSSSSSSDFEFTISLSPRQASTSLCPADELFYKGQLLPLHLSPRISLLQSLILSSSTSSSDSTSRDSTASSTDFDSSRSSSVEYDHFRFTNPIKNNNNYRISLSRFLFRKDSTKNHDSESHFRRISSTAKRVFRKCLNKVRPKMERSGKEDRSEAEFSGNLRFPRMRNCGSSCPSSIRSSPSHSGVLSVYRSRIGGSDYADMSSMDEVQSAIQGAIAHCKNSMAQTKTMAG